MSALGPTTPQSLSGLSPTQKVKAVDADRRRDPSEQRDQKQKQERRDTLDLHPTEENDPHPVPVPTGPPKREDTPHLDLRG
jgi:hypothetical protein